jgi:DNA invertase Pin-like site-specific DNA recombinase
MILSYTRVSTAEQADNNATSLKEQERKNRAIASLRGAGQFDFANYVDAGISGSIPLGERPAGKRLLDDANPGDVIVASKLDRLFRSAADALTTLENLRKRKIDVILIDMGTEPVTSNGAAKMFFGMMAMVAEFERERIAERMTDGRRGKLARNGHIGGSAPYGYRVIGKGREARVEPDREELDVARMIARMGKNWGMRFVLQNLKEMGVKTRTGKDFQFVQVRRIVDRAKRVQQ